MSTSPTEGVILYDPGDFDTDEPLDTVAIRDELLGSAMHKADEAGQVRAAWVALATGFIDEPYLRPHDPHGTPEVATSGRDKWYCLGIRPIYLPKVRADRTGYRLRVWLAGASSAGDRVDFAVWVIPHRGTTAALPDAGYPFKRIRKITSTTPAELTFDDSTRYIDVPRELVDEALAASGASWVTKEDIGGAPISVSVPVLDVQVLGQTWDAGSVPLLFGCALAEYIGP